jgi:hypothetical protein
MTFCFDNLLINLSTQFQPCFFRNIEIVLHMNIRLRKNDINYGTAGNRAMKAKRRCRSTPSLTSTLDGEGGQRHAPAALPPVKRPHTHIIGGWVDSKLVLTESVCAVSAHCTKLCVKKNLKYIELMSYWHRKRSKRSLYLNAFVLTAHYQ